ncbi:hypothetical protein ACFCX4_28760 [Kitasatospora sp. NPDC056327]|uniref:hypothetical protein n=1 Tax=Kitasatospora sp. NPDC056327 TaxID=3345785 RepID=UPI0035DF1164
MTASHRRILLAVLLCCAVTSGLGACTPIDEDPTLTMASEDVEDYEPAGDEDGEEYWEETGAEDAPGLDSAAPAAPAAGPSTCTTAAGHRVVRVLGVTDGRLTVRPSCAPDAEPATHALAAHATATLVDLPHGEPAKEVQLPVLLDHLDACLADGDPEPPYACYGNTYDLALDVRGRITRIQELRLP